MGKTVTADFGDEPNPRVMPRPRTTTEDARPRTHAGGGENVCAKVAESLATIAEPGLTQPS